VTIGISSDSDDRPSIEEGDSALYRNANHFIHLKKDGSIDIKAAAGVNVDCDIVSTGNVTDHTSSLDELRQDFEAFVQSYNMHFHACAAPSSPSGPPQQPPAPPEI
jgi:phage gp45-like